MLHCCHCRLQIFLGVWQTMRRPTRILTWPGPGTRMLLLLRTGRYEVNKLEVLILCCRQSEACSTFEKLSTSAKAELAMQKKGRVEHMRSNMQQLVELEVKNGKAHSEVLRQAIHDIREM